MRYSLPLFWKLNLEQQQALMELRASLAVGDKGVAPPLAWLKWKPGKAEALSEDHEYLRLKPYDHEMRQPPKHQARVK